MITKLCKQTLLLRYVFCFYLQFHMFLKHTCIYIRTHGFLCNVINLKKFLINLHSRIPIIIFIILLQSYLTVLRKIKFAFIVVIIVCKSQLHLGSIDTEKESPALHCFYWFCDLAFMVKSLCILLLFKFIFVVWKAFAMISNVLLWYFSVKWHRFRWNSL